MSCEVTWQERVVAVAAAFRPSPVSLRLSLDDSPCTHQIAMTILDKSININKPWSPPAAAEHDGFRQLMSRPAVSCHPLPDTTMCAAVLKQQCPNSAWLFFHWLHPTIYRPITSASALSISRGPHTAQGVTRATTSTVSVSTISHGLRAAPARALITPGDIGSRRYAGYGLTS